MKGGIPMAQSRNLGIDMLRIVSMIMVVMLHVLGQGGILETVKPFSCNYLIANFFETLSYGAVDCFAIISGYVGVDSQFRYSNIVTLWRKVFFYTITIAGVSILVNPHNVSINLINQAIFPVLTSHYWYFTAYFGLFFFIPFINRFVNSLNKKEMDQCTVAVLLFFSLIPTVSNHSLFYINGYSIIWLAICYYIGAYIKKRSLVHLLSNKKSLMCLVFWGCIALTYFSVLLNDFIYPQTSWSTEDTYLNYTSPTVLISSIIIVLYFANLHLHEHTAKIVKTLSPLAFNVYIIHCNVVVWNLLSKRFAAYANISPVLFVLFLILSVSGIYAVCSAIDLIREAIERKLDLKHKIDHAVENKLLLIKDYMKQRMT